MLLRFAIPTLFALGAMSCQMHPSETPAYKPAFSWISGCWQSESGITREIWTESYDGLVFGHAITRRDGVVVFFEDLRIETDGDQSHFIASPGGSEPVRFYMSTQTDLSVTFENPAHDYPQIISYVRNGDALTATTSLANGENENVFAFTQCS